MGLSSFTRYKKNHKKSSRDAKAKHFAPIACKTEALAKLSQTFETRKQNEENQRKNIL